MKIYKLIILLFLSFVVSGCAVNSTMYNLKFVSSENKGNYTKSYSYINEELLKANIIIFNNKYSSFLGIKYKENNTYGSGFIYNEDNNYYYALTNNHVIDYDYSYSKNELVVEDYYGNKYEVEVVCSDVNYDLAVIKFEKKVNLKVLDFSEDDVNIMDSVRAIGNPDSNKNVVSSGVVNCFNNININIEDSKVNFNVIVHSASIQGGSSGGALLNKNGDVVGVTFAGVFDSNGKFVVGYAIPLDKVNEFISKYI